MSLPAKLAKRIAGECRHCSSPALDDSDYCGPHDAHERSQRSKRQRRLRQKRAAAGQCVVCCRKVARKRKPDGSFMLVECKECAEAHRKRVRDARVRNESNCAVTTNDHAARIAARMTSVVDSSDGYARTRMKGGKRGAPSMEEQRRNDLIALRRILASYEESFAVTYSQEVRNLSREQQAAARRASDAHLALAVRLGMEALVRYGYEVPVLHPDEIGEDDDETDS